MLPNFQVTPEGRKCIISFVHSGVEFILHASVPAEQAQFVAPKMVQEAIAGEAKRAIRISDLLGLLEEALDAGELAGQAKTYLTYSQQLNVVLSFVGIGDDESINVLNSLKDGYSIPERYERSGGSPHVLRLARAMFSKRAIRIYERAGIPPSTFSHFVAFTPKQVALEPFSTSTEEVDRIIERCNALPEENPEFYKIYLLAMGCGLRSSEILRAKFSDLRELSGNHYVFLEQTKSKTKQKTGIPKRVYHLLKSYEGDDSNEFIVQGANRPKLVQREFVEFLREEVGIEDRKPVHRLRKILGARMATTHGIFAASKTLRHSSVTTTEKYYADLIEHKNDMEV